MRYRVGQDTGLSAPPARGRDLRAGVPAPARVAERRLPADGHAGGPRRRAGRVLGLRAHQLAAHAALPQGLARALRRGRPARDRRALPRLLVRARPRRRGARGRAPRGRLPGRCSTPSSRSGASTATGAGRAATCSTAPACCATSTTARATTSRPSWRSRSTLGRAARAARAAAPGGRARRAARAADRRHRAAGRARAARAGARLGRRARTTSRPPTPARRRSFSFSGGAAYAVLSGAGVEPGLYEIDGRVEAESPGLRLHGVQFTPAPPAPGGSPSGA